MNKSDQAPFNNLVQMFFGRAATYDDAPFLWQKENGQWVAMSWRKAAHQVAALASALQRIGLKPGERVMIVSENRPEFCIADLGIMAAGCITVPTYITNTESDHAHVLADSGARAVIVSGAKTAKNFLPAVIRAGSATIVIGMEDLHLGQASGFRYYDWKALLAVEHGDPHLVAEAATFQRADLACLIYTSGTGGTPRGVMQSHGAILANCMGAADVIENDFPPSREIFLSFLPLSHAYEHTAGQFFPIYLGAQIYYAEGLEKLAANIQEVRPTVMVVVPRLFELLRTKILKSIEGQGALAQGLLKQALRHGKRPKHGLYGLLNQPLNLALNATIRRKVRARFGGRMKAMVSGGAPLNPEIGHFFQSLGINLLQGYGLTESGPVAAVNRPSAGIKMDTVGPPLKGVEIKIAEDGEILIRGELVMLGYWNRPHETAAALVDGWLHTGDVGHLDSRGRLVITDRKKDLIVNDKGDNVSPQKVEGMLTLAPEIHQAMVVGDQRPHLVGLIVPDPDWARDWAREKGAPRDLESLCANADFQKDMMVAVDRVNTKLSVLEKVRRIMLTPEAFTVDNGMLTPSIKIRRGIIKSKYAAQLDGLYGKH